MELITHTLAAGATARFERAGRYFELIDADGRVSVELTGPAGELADEMVNALSGFYSEEAFAGLTISNPEAYAQAVRFMVARGRGGSRRQPGTVSVIDTVRDEAKTVSNDAPVAAIAFAYSVMLAPASNTAGATVLGASSVSLPTSTGWAKSRVVAAKVAPANFAGTDNMVVLADTYSKGDNLAVSEDWAMRRRLPAGWGIYHLWQIDTGAQAVGGRVSFQLG